MNIFYIIQQYYQPDFHFIEVSKQRGKCIHFTKYFKYYLKYFSDPFLTGKEAIKFGF